MRCPECSKQKTRVVRRGYAGAEPLVAYWLIGVNVLAFIAAIATGGTFSGGVGGADSVFAKSALFGPAVADGDWYRVITSGFMHYGVFHLGLNMWALYVIGQLLEPAVGHVRFALIYFVSLLGGSLGALIVTPNALTAGASGAVFGVMAGALIVARERGADPIAQQLGFFLVINVVFTFAASNISIGGHIGGMTAGAISTTLLLYGDRLSLPRWAPLVLASLLGVGAFVGCLLIA